MIAHRDGKHVCYTTTNGRDRHYLGCAHDTPRAAIRHAIPVYVPATRAALNPDGTTGDLLSNHASEEASVQLRSLDRAVPPDASPDLGL